MTTTKRFKAWDVRRQFRHMVTFRAKGWEDAADYCKRFNLILAVEEGPIYDRNIGQE